MASTLERLEQLHRPPPGPAPPASPRRRGLQGALIATLIFLIAKGKAVLLLLGKAKIWMFWKTGATMLVAAWAYAGSMGWPLAAALIALILVHEMGHVWAAHRVGIPVSAPMFVPFIGAFIQLRGKPRSPYDEFTIAAGGPLAGSAAAGLCLMASVFAEGQAASLLRVAGYYALVLNLFNLTPFWTLDGARMLAPVDPRDGLIGAIAASLLLLATAIYTEQLNPIGLIAAAACLWRMVGRWRGTHRAPGSALERLAAPSEPEVASTPSQRRTAAVVYFGALAGLGAAVQLLWSWLPQL